VSECYLTDIGIVLLRINGMYLTLTLSNGIAAVSRDNMHKGVLFNFNHTELYPSSPGLILKIKRATELVVSKLVDRA